MEASEMKFLINMAIIAVVIIFIIVIIKGILL